MEIEGTISLGGKTINVYRSLDGPIFKALEIAELIEYSNGNTWKMLKMCEEDEKLNLPMVVSGQTRRVSFVNEHGLYNILAQSDKPVARYWRRVVHNEIIALRKSKEKNIVEQFQDWDAEMDTLYIDPDTGIMMRSVTVQGGDVVQVPYRKEI